MNSQNPKSYRKYRKSILKSQNKAVNYRIRKYQRKNIKNMLKGNTIMAKETIISGTKTMNTGDTYFFRVNLLPQIANYQNLFRSYRLLGVKMTFIPNFTGGEQYNDYVANTSNPSGPFPAVGTARLHLRIVRDQSAMTTPTSEGDILVKGATTHLFDKPVSIYIKNPRFALSTQQSNTDSLPTKGWLDLTNSADINHYGLETWVEDFGSSNSNSYKILYTYIFACRGTK